MRVGKNKTKTVKVLNGNKGTVNITIKGQPVEQVKKFKYLKFELTEDGTYDKEVKIRVAMAKEAFTRRKELLSKNMIIAVKKKFVKRLVWPVAPNGWGTWAMRK